MFLVLGIALGLGACENSIYMRMRRGEITREQARAEMAPGVMMANANFQGQMAENARQAQAANTAVGRPYKMTRVDYRSGKYVARNYGLTENRVRLRSDFLGGARGYGDDGTYYRVKPNRMGNGYNVDMEKGTQSDTIRLRDHGSGLRGYDDAGHYYRTKTDSMGTMTIERD